LSVFAGISLRTSDSKQQKQTVVCGFGCLEIILDFTKRPRCDSVFSGKMRTVKLFNSTTMKQKKHEIWQLPEQANPTKLAARDRHTSTKETLRRKEVYVFVFV